MTTKDGQKRKPGRPKGSGVIYGQDERNRILQRLEDGESLRSICKDETLPDERTVRRWADEDEVFAPQYARARNLALDNMAEDVIAIADDKEGDAARDRLRFDARRWYLSKLAPKRYGDRVAVDHGAQDSLSDLMAQIAERGRRAPGE